MKPRLRSITRRRRTKTRSAVPQHVSLEFELSEVAGDLVRKEIRQNGWPLHPFGFPTALAVDKNLVARELSPRELVAVTVIADALAGLMEVEPRIALAWAPGRGIVRTDTAVVAGRSVEVTVAAPFSAREGASLARPKDAPPFDLLASPPFDETADPEEYSDDELMWADVLRRRPDRPVCRVVRVS